MLTIHFKAQKPLSDRWLVVHPYICHLILCTWPLSNSTVFARITPIALPPAPTNASDGDGQGECEGNERYYFVNVHKHLLLNS